MEHHCQQKAIIEEITSKLKTQKSLGEETFAAVDSLGKELAEHRAVQQKEDLERLAYRAERAKHDEKIAETMKDQAEIMTFVKKNLIPAYEREVNAENAKKYIKERAKNWSFWVGVAMGTITLFWAFVYIFKKVLGIDK